MNLQIANPEIVNLLVEEQMDRFEKEKKQRLEQRRLLVQNATDLWDDQEVICEQAVHADVEEDVATMLEAMSRVFNEPVPTYHLKVCMHGPFRNSAASFEKIESIAFQVMFMSGSGEDAAEHFSADDDDDDSSQLEAFMARHSIDMECPIDPGIKEGVLQCLKEISAIDDRIREINSQVDDREALSRKLLAQLTAKTLQNNPEQVALIKQALSGFEHSQLCIGRDEPTTE